MFFLSSGEPGCPPGRSVHTLATLTFHLSTVSHWQNHSQPLGLAKNSTSSLLDQLWVELSPHSSPLVPPQHLPAVSRYLTTLEAGGPGLFVSLFACLFLKTVPSTFLVPSVGLIFGSHLVNGRVSELFKLVLVIVRVVKPMLIS